MDLFYRIAVMQVTIPPLRDRTEDIECLVQHFIDKYRPGSDISLSSKVFRSLKNYKWPGNVRELENVVQRILSVIKGNTGTLYPRDVVSCIPTPKQDRTLVEDGQFDLAWIEKQVIERALQHFVNQAEAVKHLGISESKFRRKIQEFGITYERKRKSREEIQFEELSGIEKQLQLIRNYILHHETFTTRDIVELLNGVANKTAIAKLNELIKTGEVIRITRGEYRRV